MRRITLLFAAVCLLTGPLQSQNVDDALRYSQVFYTGSSRFMSMGGAFTALGGDLSSLSQNPAGIGVFRSSEFSITPQLNYINTTAGFHGTTSEYLYDWNLAQAGFVRKLSSRNSDVTGVRFNFGYTFNKTSNLNQMTRIKGVNTSSSMADYWANSSEGTNFHDLSGPAGIAYDAWIIDTITGSGGRSYGTVFNNYGDNPPSEYGQSVSRVIEYDGFTGEHAISLGGSYSDKVFFGATFGIHQLRFSSMMQHSEVTTADLPSAFRNFNYVDYYEDKGTGYSLKFGVILKPVDALRLGVAIHTPVWYHIDEYYYESISSNFTDGGKYESANDPMRFSYALSTPFRILAGAALQIQKIALISADYEFVDYSTARFSQTGDGYDYSEKNDIIRNTLRTSSNFRIGGELRFNQLYLRSGYGYYGKAFRTGEDNAGLDYNTISAGIGFREKSFSLDFGYTRMNSSQVYYMYPLDSSYDPASANLINKQNMFSMTLGFKF